MTEAFSVQEKRIADLKSELKETKEELENLKNIRLLRTYRKVGDFFKH